MLNVLIFYVKLISYLPVISKVGYLAYDNTLIAMFVNVIVIDLYVILGKTYFPISERLGVYKQ